MQLFGMNSKAPPAPAGGDVIKDGSTATFAADVIQASQDVPVLVDFWAPWCGPCKQLGPVLEKVVTQAKGRVRLVKINIDENPELAQQLRVQSVPTVYAFVGGQPVTGFAGAQPESQVAALVEKLAGGPLGGEDVEAQLTSAREALDQGDTDTASRLYGAVLENEPENAEALGGLARCMLSMGEREAAKEVLSNVPKELADHAAIAGARAALTLAEEAGDLGDLQELEARLARDADDHDARAKLATALFLRGQAEKAIDELCQIVRRDRTWNEDGAREQLLRFFAALGPTHPQTLKGRRKLSSVLFA